MEKIIENFTFKTLIIINYSYLGCEHNWLDEGICADAFVTAH